LEGTGIALIKDTIVIIMSQLKFTSIKLDPALLSTPFDVHTNWHVITGAPSCGKTTLIDLLTEEGFKIVPEGAREYMEGEIAAGRTIEEIHSDGVALQRSVCTLQIQVESRLPSGEVAFLDGALPGSLAWYRVFGLDPNEILPGCFRHRYASVFVLDRLPTQLDGLRFDDEALADFLDEWIARDYETLGYQVVRVPVLAPKERLAFVLEMLPDRG